MNDDGVFSTWEVTQGNDGSFVLCIFTPNQRTFRKVLIATAWSSAITEARVIVARRGIE